MSIGQGSSTSAIMDQAVAWHVRLNSGDADVAEFEAFGQWLAHNPAHRLAYDRVEELSERIDDLGGEVSVLLLARPELSAPASNIVPFSRLPRLTIAVRVIVAAAAVFLLAIGAASLSSFGRGDGKQEARYETKSGEIKTVTLADGSKITLNISTRLSVAETHNSRRINLDSGEALFKVAHDASRPLIVTTGDRDIRDIGTTFNVLRDKGQITVTVAEGAVSLAAIGAPLAANSTRLGPGDQWIHREGTAEATVRHVNTDSALAWPNGFLNYQNAPLSQVVEDLNRYFGGSIALQNDELGDVRFSGVLKMDGELSVVQRLTQFMPIASSQGPDGKITLRARPSGG